MRLAFVIVALAAVAVGLVQLRRREIGIRHEIQQIRLKRVALRRTLWDQQVRLGYLTGPQQINRRVEDSPLGRTDTTDRLVRTDSTARQTSRN